MDEIILLTCSGLSSTGKLTKQAAIVLMQRCPGLFDCHVDSMNIENSVKDIISGCSIIFAVDGCSDCCAEKKLSSCGLNPSGHIVATDLGIEKRGAQDPSYKEVETLFQAIKKKMRESELNQN